MRHLGIYKKSSGLIFDDTFRSEGIHSRYEISPSNSCYLDEGVGRLTIPHTAIETSILFDIPKEENTLLIEVTADYVPTESGDQGGILVWQDGCHRLEFLESPDTTTKEFSKWRALKKGNRWTFYADKGNGWELFDSEILVAEKLGIVLKNAHAAKYVPMDVNRLVLCKSGNITIGNLPADYTVYLCDPDGNSIASAKVESGWTGVEIGLPSIPYRGTIKVFDSDGNLLSSLEDFDIYGGDSFLYGSDLRVLWKGTELNVKGETYLGTMYDDQILVQLELLNPSEEVPADDCTLGILQYKDKFGYQWVDLCNDDDGSPTLDFKIKLNMGRLDPLRSKKFWMKVGRKSEHFDIKPMNFLLDVTHK
ncbi:hypothetical protein BLGI_2317 [Brevibacillus laterosporus GI-9]|uniref:hypothetical protein n=1 Tax=Brevibacillus laterosporus TaxID=1465 RepID=UPI0002403B4A|nr:hypothetical protein BLGI_2317 [Brevibacillus laterosporus GI-9]